MIGIDEVNFSLPPGGLNNYVFRRRNPLPVGVATDITLDTVRGDKDLADCIKASCSVVFTGAERAAGFTMNAHELTWVLS